MNLSRCENGHFYDKEKYSSCPHCAGGAAADQSLTTIYTEQAGGSGGSPAQGSFGQAAPSPVSPVQMSPTPAPVQPASSTPLPLTPNASTEGTVPVDFTPEDSFPTAPLKASQLTVGADNLNFLDTPTEKLSKEDEIIPGTMTVPAFEDNDHTVAFYDEVFAHAAPVQEHPYAGSMVPAVSSPCVGWLIAIGGVHIGQDFRLKVGKNFIGRDESMDIAMTGDKSVSRNRHAIVIYEPKQHLYLIQPGESSALVYCNDKVVLSPVQLKPYDIITIGEINLLFLPLCGDKFSWSELLEEMAGKNLS